MTGLYRHFRVSVHFAHRLWIIFTCNLPTVPIRPLAKEWWYPQIPFDLNLISLREICVRLYLASEEDAEYIVGYAILSGVRVIGSLGESEDVEGANNNDGVATGTLTDYL